MDDKTTISELKELVKKFAEERDWDKYHSAKELAIGIITEASELLEPFRFKNEREVEEMFNDATKKEHLSEEVADIFFFLLRFGQRYNIDLVTAFKNKLEKNAKKYPVDKVKGLNKKYNEY